MEDMRLGNESFKLPVLNLTLAQWRMKPFPEPVIGG